MDCRVPLSNFVVCLGYLQQQVPKYKTYLLNWIMHSKRKQTQNICFSNSRRKRKLQATNRDGAGVYAVDGRQIEARAPACSASSSVRASGRLDLDSGWTPSCCCAKAEAGGTEAESLRCCCCCCARAEATTVARGPWFCRHEFRRPQARVPSPPRASSAGARWAE